MIQQKINGFLGNGLAKPLSSWLGQLWKTFLLHAIFYPEQLAYRVRFMQVANASDLASDTLAILWQMFSDLCWNAFNMIVSSY